MIPDNLIPLADVLGKLPGHTVSSLRQLARRRQFPDVLKVGGIYYVREPQLERWLLGSWESSRQAAEEIAFHTTKQRLRNRLGREKAS